MSVISLSKIGCVLLFAVVNLAIAAAVSDRALLEKQTVNHFRKYLSERNRFDGIEHLGGPFLEQDYATSSSGKVTCYNYTRPLGLFGDPNELEIKTCLLPSPVTVSALNMSYLQKLDASKAFFEDPAGHQDVLNTILTVMENGCSVKSTPIENIRFIRITPDGKVFKKDVGRQAYFGGIESLGTGMWQIYFRRGHHVPAIDSDDIEYLPLTITPAAVMQAKLLKNGYGRKADERDGALGFFLYGEADESTVTDLCDTLRTHNLSIAAATFDGHTATVVYSQKREAEPFGHPFFNEPLYSAIVVCHGEECRVVSVSAVVDRIPEGIRQSYSTVGLLLEKPPAAVAQTTVENMVWPGWCDADVEKYLTGQDLFQICELYLRVPFAETEFPYMELEIRQNAVRVYISPQHSGDFGPPTLSLVKINGIWRIYPVWDLEDLW